ncbi:hypothetical protein BC834DRAFT_516165 [Gloeopeniophorella convolvens]|nr:hypothetical protein BC834DRAFT_516165 [Gloeopeniophorella convolvens]
MANFHDPGVIAQETLATIKFWHVVDGFFIWEFIITLNYEWSIIRGRRPYRWTIWVYSLTRVATLMSVILNMVGFDVTHKMNCQLRVVGELVFAYTAFAAASLLIVLRIVAIWDRHKIALALAAAAWGTNVGFLIHGVTKARSAWVPEQSTCAFLDTYSTRNNILVTFVTDIVLLAIMLVGLLRVQQRGGSLLGLGRLLWKQGLIWFLVATVAEATPTVFICLNLNDPMNIMFQVPSLIVMSIAATQMYRQLTDFASMHLTQDSLRSAGPAVESKRVPASAIPLGRMEVSVHTAYDSYPASPGRYNAYIGAELQGDAIKDKSRRLSLDSDLERGTK